MFYVVGSVDDVFEYDIGICKIWEESFGIDCYLLIFISVNYNVVVLMLVLVEFYVFSEDLGWVLFEYYGDVVWDMVWMNNIL